MTSESDDNAATPLGDSTLVEVAHELRRLANGLLKDVRKNAALPSLSQIAAMRPLQNLLAEALAERAFSSPAQGPEQSSDEAKNDNWFGFGIRPKS